MLYPKFESLEHRALLSSTIRGTVFGDANSSGLRDAHETGLAHQRVYLDENSDGKYQKSEPSVVTDAKGAYSFTKLAAGTYRVRLKLPDGYRQTAPQGNVFVISTSGNEVHAANDIGLTTTGIIRGTVFSDTSGDGVLQHNEAGIAGIRVYIDKNNDGQWDPVHEKSRLTNLDGIYRFQNVKPGQYAIRIIAPGGVEFSTPAVRNVKLRSGRSVTSVNWGLI